MHTVNQCHWCNMCFFSCELYYTCSHSGRGCVTRLNFSDAESSLGTSQLNSFMEDSVGGRGSVLAHSQVNTLHCTIIWRWGRDVYGVCAHLLFKLKSLHRNLCMSCAGVYVVLMCTVVGIQEG